MRTERFSGIGSDGRSYTVLMRTLTTELDRPRQRRPTAKSLQAKYYLNNGDKLAATEDCTVFKTMDADLFVTLLAI